MSDFRQVMHILAMAEKMKRFVQSALAQSPVIAQLPAADSDHLAQAARLQRFAERRTLAGRDAEAQDLYLVMEGQAEYTTISSEGDQFTLVAFGPGNWVNWLAVLAPGQIERQIEVAAGSVLVAFPSSIVRAIMARNPQAYLPLYLELGRRFRALMTWVERAALTRGASRVANLLLLLAQMSSDGRDTQEVRMSQTQLARLADCSRQTLNIFLGELREQGLITTGYGVIRIIDAQRLQRVSGNNA